MLHVVLTEVNGWYSSAGGCLVWKVQGNFIYMPVTLVGAVGRLDSAGPLFLYSVCLSSWTSFLFAQGSKCKCFKRWEVVTVSLLGLGLKLAQVSSTVFCWLTQSCSSHELKGGGIDFTSIEGVSKNLWSFKICCICVYIYGFSFLFWSVGKMGVFDKKVTGYWAARDIRLNPTSMFYRLK